jgi:UDP-GlcNAc:undecaprenyl-phosphate GlcNAc-1-phosphate transferase
MQYILISFAALVVTVFITPYFINLFNKIKIVDLPDGKRKVHTIPKPRMGGIIIFIVVISFLFIFYSDLNSIKFFLFGCVIIIALGTYDDLFGAGWLLKFLYQSIAAVCLLIYLIPHFPTLTFFGFVLQPIPASILLFFFIVGTINAFNLLDGLDGLASGISLLVSVLLFFLGLNTMNIFLLILLSSFIGCMTGFLKYNAYPARIFLGDSGSLILGYLVTGSVLLLSIRHTTRSLDLTFATILLAVPIADTVKVMSQRILKGKHPFLADKSHIHHIVFSKNIRHKTTVFIITIYSLIFAANAIYYRFYSEVYGLIIFFLLLIPLIFANRILNFIINSEQLLMYGRTINRFPQNLINYYKVGVVPAVAVFILFSFIFLLAAGKIVNSEFLIPSLIILCLLLLFTLINYRKSKIFTDVIVFFNILLFFIINQTNTVLYWDISNLPILGNINFHLLIIAVLFPVVGFYLFFRDRIQQNRDMLFTGLDLMIVLSIVLLSISSNLIPIARSYIITDTIFRSFLIYIFYKIMIQIQPKFRLSLYAFSFLTVLLSQTILLISR